MGKTIPGLGKQSNLDKWANYARKNSYDGNECRRQSRHDLDSSNIRETDDMAVPDVKTKEGRGFYHPSDVSRTNSYTGKGGSKRD